MLEVVGAGSEAGLAADAEDFSLNFDVWGEGVSWHADSKINKNANVQRTGCLLKRINLFPSRGCNSC
jgi:hypothetical protein